MNFLFKETKNVHHISQFVEKIIVNLNVQILPLVTMENLVSMEGNLHHYFKHYVCLSLCAFVC